MTHNREKKDGGCWEGGWLEENVPNKEGSTWAGRRCRFVQEVSGMLWVPSPPHLEKCRMSSDHNWSLQPLLHTLLYVTTSLSQDHNFHRMVRFVLRSSLLYGGLQVAPVVKVHLPMQRHEFNPWVRRIPWSRKGQPIPVFLPGKFHGQRILVGYSPWGCKL